VEKCLQYKSEVHLREMCPSATSSTANPTWADLVSDQRIYSEMSTTYSLRNYVVTANVRKAKCRT